MKRILVQMTASLVFAVLSAMTSFSNVWPSYAIEMLKSDQSPLGFKITDGEGNLISSIPMLGSLISTLATGYVTEALGRKKTHILCALIYTVAWSLIVTSRTAIQILVGRFVIGLSSGMAVASVILYISEVTQLTLRGSGTSMAAMLYNMGILVSYLLGWFCSYDVICYISLSAIVIYVILMTLLKETPSYLLKMGREKEALNSLKFYRGESEATEAILKELEYLKSQTHHDHIMDTADAETPILEKEKLQSEKGNLEINTESKNSWVLLFTIDYNRRALISAVVFMILSVFMGMVAVQTYASQFFARAAPTLSPGLCSVLLAVVLVATSIMTMLVTDLVTRRTLMISTCMVTTICLVTLGAVMHWPGAPVWVAPLAIVVYCIVYHLGVINIVFIQMAETFGPQVNSLATAIILSFMFASNFTVLYLFGPTVEYLGIDGTFFAFAIIAGVTTAGSVFFLKETRHVPLEIVQKMYAKGYFYQKCDADDIIIY